MVESVRFFEQGSILVGKEVKERRIAASLELNESKGVADDATNVLATAECFPAAPLHSLLPQA